MLTRLFCNFTGSVGPNHHIRGAGRPFPTPFSRDKGRCRRGNSDSTVRELRDRTLLLILHMNRFVCVRVFIWLAGAMEKWVGYQDRDDCSVLTGLSAMMTNAQ